ncbi:winged helix-turn-helix transcriptional regulator [Veillonellaceae bacterium WCA-693-APC-5D-A]|uniref:Winged helix-turn-helix transcriptional regulator n=1 Tax=Anaerovibrio slackiae TaxID=2652309 RepID=A0A6I2UH44_9FIRM|nr:winged helix-turn-helix transcriptional regulator [Anaerovibrio slackiae]
MRFVDYRNDAKLFKALSDENRLQILAQLNAEEKCACVLLEKLAISQPTLSHHMRVLVDARLVECRREGKWMYYSLRRGAKEELSGIIEAYMACP